MTDESHHGMEEFCTYNVLAVDLLSLKIRLDSCHEDLINITYHFLLAARAIFEPGLRSIPYPSVTTKCNERFLEDHTPPSTWNQMRFEYVQNCSNGKSANHGKSTSFIPRYTCLDHLPISRCNADAAGVLGTELVVCQVQARNKQQLLQSFLPVVALGTNQVLKHPIASSSPISEWKTERDWIRVKSEPPCVHHCNTCCG